MRRHVYAFLAGVVFAAGLAVSGMTRPSKVRGFLDFFGDWDPTLAFVLGPAVGIYFLGTTFAKRRNPQSVAPSPAPERIGVRFVIGSVLFGIGWGLVGICPGPALVVLGQGSGAAFLFFGMLALGIGATDRVLSRSGR